MASRVNKKFVVLLSGFLVLTGVGAGGAYYFVKMRSGEHYVAMGDKAMKEGKIDVADKWYERAVGKEQFNVEWLKKWRAAREQKVAPQNEYSTNYAMLQGILRNLAQAQKTNVEAHREFLDALLQECLYTGSRGGFEYVANHVDETLRYFETDPENPAPPQLRRYRGLAIAELLLDPNLPKDRVEQSRQDLEAALKVDPRDGDAANALAVWHRVMADRAQKVGDETARRDHIEKSRAVLREIESHPFPPPHAQPHPLGPIVLLTMDAADVDDMPAGSMSPAELIRKKTAAMDALAPRVGQVIEMLKASDPARITALHVSRVASIAPRIDSVNGRSLTLSLVDHLLKVRPDDMDLLLLRAQLLMMPPAPPAEPTPPQEIMAAFQAVIDLPDKPVSFHGLRLLGTRTRARFAQASIAIQQLASPTLTAEQKQAATTLAKAKRTDLAKYVAEASPELQFLDAKMAMLDGDMAKTRRLLAEFLKKPGETGEGSVLEAHLMMAEVGQRTNPPEPGLAREHLARVMQARPNSVELRMMLAGVEQTLQNYEGAVEQYRAVLLINPEHEGATRELERLKVVMEGGTLSDPVTQAMVTAERLAKGTPTKLGDDGAAMQVLEQAVVEHNHDPRLVGMIVNAKLQRGDREGAKQVIASAVQKRPDDTSREMARLKTISEQLTATDSLEGTVALINQTEMPELERKLSLHRTYLDFEKPEEAAKALAEAEKLSPDHPRIVDIRFQQAIQSGDLAAAGQLADRASKGNLDQADGDTFRARVQIAKKDYRDAAATLSRAVERGNAPAAVYRLLGLVQAELGRTQDAIGSFRRALDLVPTDLVTIKTFLSVLINAGERTEALGVARRAEPIGRFDPEFLNVWLQLEADSGRADFARDWREQVRAKNPKDTTNAAALAELYIDAKLWDKAREVIDGLRRDADSLRMAVLDARWHADRGSMDPAKQVLRTYIGTLTEARDKQDAYIAFGQFLLRRGLQAEGMAALRQAAANQDPKTMAVDLMLGDIQLNAGLFQDAEKSYRKVLDAGVADPTMAIRKRLIEAMNQAQKFAEAEAYFVALGEDADRDVDLMAQRASIAKGLGDSAKAKAILDRAITRFPDEPMPYLRRARLVLGDPAYAKDAMADLATAIRLRPSFWQALRTRAMFALGEGRVDEGMNDLREAVTRNPANEDLRLEFLDYLVRLGRETEAVDTADAALKSRPNDIRLMTQFATTFARSGRWTRAAKYYRMLWLQLQDEASALAYCNSLINSTPPGLAEAETVLTSRDLKVERSWRLLLARAIVRKKQGKDVMAKDDLLASFEQIGADQASFTVWARDLASVYPDTIERLKLLNLVRPPMQLTEWITLVRANIALEDKGNIETAIDALRKLRDGSTDNGLRGAVQMSLADAKLRESKWEEALEEIRLGLQYRPGDPILLNNAAAILNEKLSKPREALPFAERACATDPNNWAFADTLAMIQWALGEKAQAVAKLGDALRLAQTEVDKCKTSIKIATWKLKSEDKAGARAMLDRVREMLTDSPALKDAVKTEYEALTAELESAGK